MKTIYLSTIIAGIFLLASTNTSLSQSTDLIFETIPELSSAYQLELSPDGNLIICSQRKVAKINLNGDIIWESDFELNAESDFRCMLVDPDGSSYCALNLIEDTETGRVCYPGLLHLSADGDSLWFKSPVFNDLAATPFYWGVTSGMTQMQNGDILMTGSLLDTADNTYLMLLRTSENGELVHLFADTINDNPRCYGLDVIESANGNIYVSGLTDYYSPYPNHNAMLAKFDDQLNLSEMNHYPGDTVENQLFAFSLTDHNNGIMLQCINDDTENLGYTEFRHIGYDGTELSNQSIGNEFGDWNLNGMRGQGMTKLNDGGFIYCAFSYYMPAYTTEGVFARYDAEQNLQWIRVIGDTTSTFDYWVSDALELNDGRLAFSGGFKNNDDERQAFLLITDANGNGDYPGYLLLGNETPLLKEFQVYPNPAKSTLMITPEKHEPCQYSIISPDGRKIKTGSICGKTELNISGIRPGIVFLQIDGYMTKKIVVN